MFGFGKKKDTTPQPKFAIGDQVKIFRGWEKPIGSGRIENRQLVYYGNNRFGEFHRFIYMVNGEEFLGSELELKTPVNPTDSPSIPAVTSDISIVNLIEQLTFACVAKTGHTVNLEIKLPKPILDSLDLGDKPMVTGTAQNGAHKTYHISGGTVTFK